MILLDEIHIYADTHGAQVAYLIRRLSYLNDQIKNNFC